MKVQTQVKSGVAQGCGCGSGTGISDNAKDHRPQGGGMPTS